MADNRNHPIREHIETPVKENVQVDKIPEVEETWDLAKLQAEGWKLVFVAMNAATKNVSPLQSRALWDVLDPRLDTLFEKRAEVRIKAKEEGDVETFDAVDSLIVELTKDLEEVDKSNREW
jgi:hypothetical protein